MDLKTVAMASKYVCTPSPAAQLYHTMKASEVEHGVQAIVVRHFQPLPSLFQGETGRVQRLLESKPSVPNALVFLQMCEPGRTFGPYDQTTHRLVMTVSNYLKILDFFGKKWKEVYAKIQFDMNTMREGKDWIRIAPGLYFQGHGLLSFVHQFDDGLGMRVTCDSESNSFQAFLEYEDELLGSCPLFLQPFNVLAQARHTLRELVGVGTGVAHVAACSIPIPNPLIDTYSHLLSPLSPISPPAAAESHGASGYKERGPRVQLF